MKRVGYGVYKQEIMLNLDIHLQVGLFVPPITRLQ